jgi:hypothetical protein
MPWFSDDTGGSAHEFGGPSFNVPGLYGRLLEHEREVVRTPDPRWAYTAEGKRGEPCPPQYLRKSYSLPALEAGEPVALPSWCHHAGKPSFADLGPAIPGLNEKIRELEGRDPSIRGYMVQGDDTVVPFGRLVE